MNNVKMDLEGLKLYLISCDEKIKEMMAISTERDLVYLYGFHRNLEEHHKQLCLAANAEKEINALKSHLKEVKELNESFYQKEKIALEREFVLEEELNELKSCLLEISNVLQYIHK